MPHTGCEKRAKGAVSRVALQGVSQNVIRPPPLDLSSSASPRLASPHHTLSLHVIVLAASTNFTPVRMVVLLEPFVSALKILLSYSVLLPALHLDIL